MREHEVALAGAVGPTRIPYDKSLDLYQISRADRQAGMPGNADNVLNLQWAKRAGQDRKRQIDRIFVDVLLLLFPDRILVSELKLKEASEALLEVFQIALP
jgi:hypothetical protein